MFWGIIERNANNERATVSHPVFLLNDCCCNATEVEVEVANGAAHREASKGRRSREMRLREEPKNETASA